MVHDLVKQLLSFGFFLSREMHKYTKQFIIRLTGNMRGKHKAVNFVTIFKEEKKGDIGYQ